MNETIQNPVGAAPTPAPQITELSGMFDLVKRSWDLIQKNVQTAVVVIAIPLVLNTVMFGIALFGGKNFSVATIAVFVVTIVAIVVMTVVTTMALTYAIDATTKGTPISTGEAFSLSFKNFVPYFIVMLLVGITTMGGSALLFIPGIILSIWFLFSMNAVMFDNARGFGALQVSRNYVSGYGWDVFLKVVGLGIIFVIASIILSIITGAIFGSQSAASQLVLSTFQSIATAVFIGFNYCLYTELKTLKAGADVHAKNDSVVIYGAAVVGAIVIISFITLIASLPKIIGSINKNFSGAQQQIEMRQNADSELEIEGRFIVTPELQ